MIVLVLEDIIAFHTKGLERYLGLSGLYPDSEDRVESILAQQHPVFNYDKYPTVFAKAAMLLYLFAKDHCFPDGNKRVAILAAITILDYNGYETTFDDDEGYNFTLEVAAAQITEGDRDHYISYLADWLKGHTVHISNELLSEIKK